jgi:CRP/FNR family transcriptional regulator, cyclic AMP receptor protein
MATMLELTSTLPEITVEPGYELCTEGTSGGRIWVLVSGSLKVLKSGVQVNSIEMPGAVIGEIAVMLGRGATASVIADSPCTLRVAEDGAAFLRSDPEISAFVATGLAQRLDIVTTYLADLKNQYGDAPGLAMVGDVLRRLTTHQGPPARPGSARDPDPEY